MAVYRSVGFTEVISPPKEVEEKNIPIRIHGTCMNGWSFMVASPMEPSYGFGPLYLRTDLLVWKGPTLCGRTPFSVPGGGK